MSASFTPGPWAFEFFEPVGFPPEYATFHLGQQSDEGPGVFGTILEGDLVLESDDENTANARLIAAAPELYEALEGVLEQFVDPQQGIDQFDSAIVRKAVERANAAIAKARGEQA